MTDPRDDDFVDITSDTDEEDAVPVGLDEVPDIREDAVEDDPTADHAPTTEG